MPRPSRAYGRPGTAVIPADWDTTHAAVMDTTHEGQILVGPPTGGPAVWSVENQQMVPPPGVPVYDGPARFVVVSDTDGRRDAVDELQPIRRYAFFLDHAESAPRPGHVIDVVVCADPALTGARLTVDDVKRGTHRFSRVLLATLTY